MSQDLYRQYCASPNVSDDKCQFKENNGCTLRGECTWLRVRPITPKSKEVGVFGGRVVDIKDEKLKNILLGPHSSQEYAGERKT